MRFAHTNLVARDWRRLARFYGEVFGCEQVGPERDQSGAWLEAGTGVAGAALRGVHLSLPGSEATLEVFSYAEPVEAGVPVANRLGFGHLAFEVDDVEATLARLLDAGGSRCGEVVRREVEAGRITFTYARDPEGNLIELQSWAR